MDSDSSEEENIDMLREAADNELFTNYLYNPAERPRKEDVTTQNVLSITKPSVRTYLQTEERLNDLKVTPEFQSFVAKRLTRIIESEVKEVGSSSCVEGKKSDSGGILLFGCSSQYVDCDDNNKEPSMENCHRQIKFRQRQKIDRKEINKRCREAAVSADWVLSHRAIAGWEPSRIGKLEVLTPDEVFIQGSGTGSNAKGKSHGAVQQDSVTDAEKKEKKRLKRKRRKERLKQEQQNVKMQPSIDEVNCLSTNKRKKKRKQDESVSLIENEQVVKKKKKTEEFLSQVNADKFTCIDKKKKEKRKKQKHMTNLMKKLKL